MKSQIQTYVLILLNEIYAGETDSSQTEIFMSISMWQS